MKAIIPVAGAGTNLRPLTYTQPKALIPIAGKTILSFIVDQLIDAGIEEYVFVIGYLGDKISDYIKHTYPDLNYQLIQQTDRKGTAHAIALTQSVVGDDELLIVFGDTISDFNVKQFISGATAQVGVRKVDDPRSFGVAELNDKNEVIHFVEKPIIPKSNMALIGVYYIKDSVSLFNAIGELLNSQSVNGEYHLTDALEIMRKKGKPFQALRVNTWYDCGKKENVLETNALLLRQMNEDNTHSYEYKGTSVIIPPVSIAAGCELNESIIGPNVSIGENTVVNASVIRNSIIGSFTKLEDIVLKSSIIGSDAYIRGNSQSLNIGDNTEIDLS